MNLNSNIKKVKPSATLAINELSNKLESQGKKIYKFGLGQSPFPVPKIIEKELQKNAYQKNYLNVSGLENLRKQVAKYHHKKNKYKYSPDNVVIGPGSKELIFQTQLVLNCDLILPSPSWVSYEPQAQILKKKVYWLPTSYKSNWHLEAKTLDKFCKKNRKNKKLLILNSPNNPSGTRNEELINIAKVAKKHKVIIIADEIYAELDFSGKYKSISHYYSEGTIVSSGLSKWCGAGGWRLGTIIFPNKLTYIKDAIRVIASETYTAVSAPIQYAAIKAYTHNHENFLKHSRLIFKFISEYIYKELIKNNIQCIKPQGGFYILCDFGKIIKVKRKKINTSSILCKIILKQTGFAMLPGSDFGLNEKKLITRIAYVDFNGQNALKVIYKKNKLSDIDIKNHFPKIHQGINKLTHWINN